LGDSSGTDAILHRRAPNRFHRRDDSGSRSGETYHAALLDSIHTEAHVWAEFQLVTRLIREGGLILIHDVQYIYGTVAGALDRIAAAGYGVVRLWTAQDGIAQDDHLGLAVIVNRIPESLPADA
jgi:hypothetical protein